MNTSPHALSVLCYGDSNTYGQDSNRGRLPANLRWTGQLQDLLGQGYYVIEEGLSGRTTDISEEDARFNGRLFLRPCLESHHPVDIAVVMLGTNDLRAEYNRSAQEIAAAVGGLVTDIQTYGKNHHGKPPAVIVVSPICVNIEAQAFQTDYTATENQEIARKSQRLGGCLRDIAATYNCAFVDAALITEPGADGIHFSSDSHMSFATALAQAVRSFQSFG